MWMERVIETKTHANIYHNDAGASVTTIEAYLFVFNKIRKFQVNVWIRAVSRDI